MDINLPVETVWMEDLLQYANQQSWGVLLAIDTNAHSKLYGPEQNARGTALEDLLF